MKYELLCKPFKSSDGKYRYFYKIQNLIDNSYYYGIHTTDDINDNYKGSGKRIKNYIKKGYFLHILIFVFYF